MGYEVQRYSLSSSLEQENICRYYAQHPEESQGTKERFQYSTIESMRVSAEAYPIFSHIDCNRGRDPTNYNNFNLFRQGYLCDFKPTGYVVSRYQVAGNVVAKTKDSSRWDGGSDSLVVEATKCFSFLTKIDECSQRLLGTRPVTRLFKDDFFGNTPLTVVLEFPENNNIFWWTPQNTVYVGITDPKFYNTPFSNCFDYLAHEFGHGIVYSTAKLTYAGQSGALNESFADIFAMICKHNLNNTAADSPDADWFIARGIKIGDRSFGAERSFANPGTAFDNPVLGKDRQVAHMRDYQPDEWDKTKDHGGVHRFSGVPNHAFYLAATRKGGMCYDPIGRIWHQAVQHSNPNDDFSTFAQRTLQIARTFGYRREIPDIIAQAWYDVGVDLRGHPDVSLKWYRKP